MAINSPARNSPGQALTTPASLPRNVVLSDEALRKIQINHTTFKIPQRYVGYYDERGHSVLAMHFLLPDVVPVEPFSIGGRGGYKPDQVADVSVQASQWPNPERYLDKLTAQGRLTTSDYGFGLRQISPSVFDGPHQNEPNPDIRGFLGTFDGHRVVIECFGYREGPPLLRCQYAIPRQGYALSVDIPEKFLPQWSGILSSLTRFFSDHEVK